MSKTASINICRGIEGGECRFALFIESSFSKHIEKTIADTGWSDFLKKHYGEKVNRHKVFSVKVAACPNGCSRPHIADIGLIRACMPVIDHENCIHCEECVRSCPDEAMELSGERIVIARDKCLECGYCVANCPTEAISCSRNGWRVLAGGRLGRHPRLGTELSGVYSSDEVLGIIGKAVKIWMKNYEERKRFGVVMDSLGYDKLLKD
ncbi:4Fe-4S binding protein [Maridesulfovibrio zosterae]|uniref:4Fe-4S binding protein n=1 Tax=Maridesulfovibrio zosterae TaxID=82171 RepID=UPI0003F91080|nr:4Fe-4S binding protein [Maridesulfovibrio zosterae]